MRKKPLKKSNFDPEDPRYDWSLGVGPKIPAELPAEKMEELRLTWNAIGADLIKKWRSQGHKSSWAERYLGKPE